MKDMKLSPKQKNMLSEPVKSEGPEYPYGLRIRLEDDQLKKLGMEDSLPKLESELMIVGKGKVCSVSANESEYGSHRCLEIQLTELSLDKPKKSLVNSLYGE